MLEGTLDRLLDGIIEVIEEGAKLGALYGLLNGINEGVEDGAKLGSLDIMGAIVGGLASGII